jgi:serine phosphatase RsbU (regulator of sigma subunit)
MQPVLSQLKFLLSALIIFGAQRSACGQGTVFCASKRSEYITTIAKYVSWPKHTSENTFTISLLGDSSMLAELVPHLLAADIKGKKPLVQIIAGLEQLPYSDLIYFNQRDSIEISKVYEHPNSVHALLVTENYPFHRSMYNFMVIDGKRKFETNSHRLEARGFSTDPLFAAMAVKNEADWEELYLLSEYELERERQTIRSQKLLLAEQEIQIAKQIEIQAQLSLHIELQQGNIEKQMEQLAALNLQIRSSSDALSESHKQLAEKEAEMEKRKALIIAQKKEAMLWDQRTREQRIQLHELDQMIRQQQGVMSVQTDAIERQKLVIWLFAMLSVLVIVSAYYIYKAYRIKKRSNSKLQEKNEEIILQNSEITRQRDKITEQKEEITDSLQYASKIQAAILPPLSCLEQAAKHSFILYRPRDIVSGDFYWLSPHGKYLYICAADCTGHGVPGAFMSMLGLTYLNEIVNAENILETDQICNQLREAIIKSINPEGGQQLRKDGMDLAICRIDRSCGMLQFSGAYNSACIARNGQIISLKADKMPIGLSDLKDKPFSKEEFQLQEADCIYLYSDGYPDQFGGPKGKKFMSKQLKQLLADISGKEPEEQHSALEYAIDSWMQGHEQIDDIVVIGIKAGKWAFGPTT